MFAKRKGGSDFSHKKGRFHKIGGCFKKREGVSLFSYLLTLSCLRVFGVPVGLIYLHHFYQYSFCFIGRTESY